jgi:hypothetical protein
MPVFEAADEGDDEDVVAEQLRKLQDELRGVQMAAETAAMELQEATLQHDQSVRGGGGAWLWAHRAERAACRAARAGRSHAPLTACADTAACGLRLVCPTARAPRQGAHAA